jgi:hypothetical protein
MAKQVITATYEKDSKRYKRFSIGKNSVGVVGTIYVEKGKDLPKGLGLKFEE